jgi:hypothetical protein
MGCLNLSYSGCSALFDDLEAMNDVGQCLTSAFSCRCFTRGLILGRTVQQKFRGDSRRVAKSYSVLRIR